MLNVIEEKLEFDVELFKKKTVNKNQSDIIRGHNQTSGTNYVMLSWKVRLGRKEENRRTAIQQFVGQLKKYVASIVVLSVAFIKPKLKILFF